MQQGYRGIGTKLSKVLFACLRLLTHGELTINLSPFCCSSLPTFENNNFRDAAQLPKGKRLLIYHISYLFSASPYLELCYFFFFSNLFWTKYPDLYMVFNKFNILLLLVIETTSKSNQFEKGLEMWSNILKELLCVISLFLKATN